MHGVESNTWPDEGLHSLVQETPLVLVNLKVTIEYQNTAILYEAVSKLPICKFHLWLDCYFEADLCSFMNVSVQMILSDDF